MILPARADWFTRLKFIIIKLLVQEACLSHRHWDCSLLLLDAHMPFPIILHLGINEWLATPLSPPAHYPCSGYFGRKGAWANGTAGQSRGSGQKAKALRVTHQPAWTAVSTEPKGSLPDLCCPLLLGGRELSARWRCTEPGQIAKCQRVVLLFTQLVKQLFSPLPSSVE